MIRSFNKTIVFFLPYLGLRFTAKREGGERSKYYNNGASNLSPKV
jgi:hypothetical protein